VITLTENAANKVKQLQEEKGGGGKLLRIFVESGGCSGFQYGMSFDLKNDDDHTLKSAGVSFLMDDASIEYMKGSEIDFDDGLQGKGFEIRNPNADSTCGCGKSFN
jgi:iron-sulfur cluster assembly protein/iron-sulfur cluster insertion protein